MNNVELLIDVANKYYRGLPTGMSDETYDQLLAEVKSSDPSFNIFDHVVFDDSIRIKHYHPFPIPQFKISFRSIDEFSARVTDGVVITPKYDGSSITAVYKDGKLFDILTRSDECSGVRQLNKLRNKVPNVVDASITHIDFEALCSVDDFGQESRGKANGLINSKYLQEEVNKYMILVPYWVQTSKSCTYEESLSLAGFVKDKDYLILDKTNLPNFDCKQVTLNSKVYPIDGFALYDVNRGFFNLHKHYATENVETEVIDIEWNMSDKFVFVPKIIINPIKVEGRWIGRCSSNGYGQLKGMRAGVGSKVKIILAKSTIPQVGAVVVPSDNFCEDRPCPYCGSKLIECGNNLLCSNQFCDAKYNYVAHAVTNIVFPGAQYPQMMTNHDIVAKFCEDNRDKFNDSHNWRELLVNTLILPRMNPNKYPGFVQELRNYRSILDIKYIGSLSWTQNISLGMFMYIYDDVFKIIYGDDYYGTQSI